MTSIASAAWLRDATLQRLLASLAAGHDEARIVGGAVRDTLMGRPVSDIDIATTTLPAVTIERLTAAGFRTIPTGIAHGTVTVAAGPGTFEVTTLRCDVATDGRHARVAFGRDWRRDAERRDFTINALYATADGQVVDLVRGLADIGSRHVRFIGDAEQRIREDHLRILRFFRFFAWHGQGRPDSDGLMACARLKADVAKLSAERVWSELRKLLAAPDPSRALLWMRQSGVLSLVLPESEKWGIDAIHGLVRLEKLHRWEPDPLLRLMAIVPPDAKRLTAMAKRLRLSNADCFRLTAWAGTDQPDATLTEGVLRGLLYRGVRVGLRDRLRLAYVAARGRAATDDAASTEADMYFGYLAIVDGWARPDLPIDGMDLASLGMAEGPELGALLRKLEDEWVNGGFVADRATLLARAASCLND